MRQRLQVAIAVGLAVVVVVGFTALWRSPWSDDSGAVSRADNPAPAESATSSAPSATPTTSAVTGPAEPADDDVVLLAAGDIASCRSRGDEATAVLLDANPDAHIATLGDNVYDSGTDEEFARCYEPTWGRHRARTRPAAGNHEYGTPGAAGYYDYFGEAAGEPDEGWYSYDLGTWHVVVLNSNCGAVGCAAGGAQERWLRQDLATSDAGCTLAYWHHPRFTSGAGHGSTDSMAALYTALYQGGADLVLAGHDHVYERLAPLDPTGRVDPARGIRSFVVGTGGRSHYGFLEAIPGSEVRKGDAYGVLALTLRPGSYDWRFLPVAGEDFTDAGTDTCH